MNFFFENIFSSIKKQKLLFICLIFFSLIMIILGIFSAINFEGGILTIKLDNVLYVKFLKNSCSFVYLIFGTLVAYLLIISVILVCCSQKYLLPISILFYFYFVYSQVVIFTSLILIYGFFNVILLLILLIVYLLTLFFIFMLIICELLSVNRFNYFKNCFNASQSCFIYLLIAILLLITLFSVILWILKSFIILLIF